MTGIFEFCKISFALFTISAATALRFVVDRGVALVKNALSKWIRSRGFCPVEASLEGYRQRVRLSRRKSRSYLHTMVSVGFLRVAVNSRDNRSNHTPRFHTGSDQACRVLHPRSYELQVTVHRRFISEQRGRLAHRLVAKEVALWKSDDATTSQTRHLRPDTKVVKKVARQIARLRTLHDFVS